MTRFASSGSARLAYAVEGAGPTVLLAHAEVTDRRSWPALIERLTPTHRTVAFDQRGCGDTTYEPEPFSSVDDALAVLDHAGVEGPVAVVGSSRGGRLALDLALEHPDRVDRLVLIGAACRGAPEPHGYPESHRELDHAIEAAHEAGDLDTVNQLEAWRWLDGPMAREHRVSGPVRELFLDMNGRPLTAPDPGPEAELPSAWDRLDRVAVPTLVLVGELDLEDVVDTAEGLAQRIPGARYEMLYDTAHLPHLEAHPRALEAITEFLEA